MVQTFSSKCELSYQLKFSIDKVILYEMANIFDANINECLVEYPLD